MAKRIQNFREFNSSKVEEVPLKQKNQGYTKNVERNKKKKREVKKHSNKIIVVFFVMLMLIGLAVGCLFSPVFNLSAFIVNDGKNISRNEILNSFSVSMNTNIFKINYREIKKSVMKLPYIRTATVKMNLPDKINIDYEEREPFALIKYLESYLVMDKYGYILEISREKKFEALPIIYNIEFDTYEIGNQLSDNAKTKYDNVVYLIENAIQSGFEYSISEINYESISDVKMWVAEEDIEIIYGEIDRNCISDKLKYISEILSKVKGKNGMLDVSSKNYLAKTVFTERL